MSGNPFRASPSQTSSSTPQAPPVSFIVADSSNRSDGAAQASGSGTVDSPAPIKTKKTVRIESPTSSPPQPAFHDADDTLSQRMSRGQHADSLPPVSPAGFSDSFETQFPAEPFYKDSPPDATNAWEYPGRAVPVDAVDSMQSSLGAPVNPFSRTLANIEPQEKNTADAGHPRQRKDPSDRLPAEKPGTGALKSSLDVEGFKRLLMKGIPSSPSSASQHPATSTPAAPSVPESSSTDTSSISRHSIGPVSEPHVDTPRTSYEMASSDDETGGLVSNARTSGKRKPPPAPKSRHGKLVTPRAPQTVSFSDFSATQSDSSPASRTRKDSDVNKPLPPIPPVHSPAPVGSTESAPDARPLMESMPSNSSDTPSQSESPSTNKRAPPPVPIARRQSQLRASTASNRSRSNSNLTISSQQSVEYSVTPGSNVDDVPPSSQKSAPPPPPARRQHGTSLSAKNPPNMAPSNAETQSISSIRSDTVGTMPTPPTPRRTTFSSPPASPSTGQAGLARTASMSSSRNTSRAVSNESATMPPPPPPPPRRRQSGRSSMDKERPMNPLSPSPSSSRRGSTEYKRSSLDGRRTSMTSESSLRHVYAPTSEDEHALQSPAEEKSSSQSLGLISESNSTNILDDMEKFQREIDELRERYKQ